MMLSYFDKDIHNKYTCRVILCQWCSPRLRNKTCDDCSEQFPDVFAAGAVTCSATRAVARGDCRVG